MSMRDEALLFVCDEAACHEDPMFYEIFSMDDRWSIIRTVLNAAEAHRIAFASAQSNPIEKTHGSQSCPPGHEICSACQRVFKFGETCTRGGCPCGGDV